jgi:lambda family phage portal protein
LTRYLRTIQAARRSSSSSPPAARRLSAYEATESNKRTESWLHPSTEPMELLGQWLPMLVQRSRDLARKNPLVISAFDVLVDNVAGTTFNANPQVVIPGTGQPDVPLNEELEAYFREVAEEELDFTRQSDYTALRGLIYREVLEAGETFILLSTDVRDRSRITPAAIELIAAERVDPTLDRRRGKNQNRITNGIEFDARGRRLAYHVTKLDPDGSYTGSFKTVRIPADRILHVYRRLRIGQERGLPAIYGAAMLARDFDILLDTELTSAQVAACLSVFISREGGGVPELDSTGTLKDGRSLADTRDGRPLYHLQPGAVFDTAVGDTVEAIDPKRPSGAFDPFATTVTRLFGKTVGLSYEKLTGDLRRTSFASGKLGDLADRKTFNRGQHLLYNVLDRPVYRYALRWGAQMDRVPFSLTEWMAGSRRLGAVTFTGETPDHAQPVQEANAAALRIAFGLSTWSDEVAGRGGNFRRLLERRLRDEELLEASGIKVLHPAGAQEEQEDEPEPAGGDPGTNDPPPQDTPEDAPEEVTVEA